MWLVILALQTGRAIMATGETIVLPGRNYKVETCTVLPDPCLFFGDLFIVYFFFMSHNVVKNAQLRYIAYRI